VVECYCLGEHHRSKDVQLDSLHRHNN
jgi:hypothetical protein